MTATISKWGNSQGLRMPKEIMKDLHLAIGDKVLIHIEEGKLVIEPIKEKRTKIDIKDLVAKIPKDYSPKEEIDTSMGIEEW